MQLMVDVEAARAVRSESGGVRAADVILRHANFLPDRDRLLLDLFYRRGLTRTDVARVFGQSVGTVSRRINRLTGKLRDPLVLALIEAPDSRLAAVHRAIGISHFLCDEPMNHLARVHAMPRHEVKHVIEYLKGWAKGQRAQ